MRKRFLLLTALILASGQMSHSKELFNGPEDLNNFNKYFYEASVTQIPQIEEDTGLTVNRKKELRATPLFKKYRIKATNYFRSKDIQNAEKIIEKEKKENINNEKPVSELKKDFKGKVEESASEKTIELEGGVKQQVTSNDALLDADNLDYNAETKDITATGSPILIFPPQQITLKADKMIYNSNSNILKAYGNVQVIRDDSVINGDFLQVNMNEENSFMENIDAKKSYLTIKARSGTSEGDKIILYNGKFHSHDSHVAHFRSQMIGGNNFYDMMVAEDDKSSLTNVVGYTPIKIKAKEVYVNAKKDHDVITLKKASLFYGDRKLFTMPSFTSHTNKSQEYFDANYPEFGSRVNIGMFAGPGFVFDVPNGAIVKAIPFLNYKNKIGIGGALKYRSGTNMTEFAYGTSNDIFVLRGKQNLDDKLYMQYGANSYMDDWFMGMRLPKYAAELIYRDSTSIKSTIKKDLGLNFEHRASFGYMQDNDFNRYGEDIPTSNLGTTRTRYMAEARQELYSYRKPDDLISANVSLVMQGSAALYGTGDTQFVGRVGPRLTTQYKGWIQDITYYMSGYQDNTPMPVFDAYRYGHSNVMLREAYRINKYVTVAWSGSFNLSDDSYNGKLFQENSFILAVGPDDLKFSIGYDVVREQTYFAINVLMDTKGSSLEYEKMEIKNPDRLAKNEKKEEKLIPRADEVPVQEPLKKMMYAEVIEIEDPNREDM